jgi:hypothetical protein
LKSPDELLRKAERAYPEYLRSVVLGTSIFPLDLPWGKAALRDADFEALRRWIASLRASPIRFSIDWVERDDRRWGRQQLPDRIYFAEAAGYLDALGKTAEAALFREHVGSMRKECPELEPWVERNALKVVEKAEAWPGLL